MTSVFKGDTSACGSSFPCLGGTGGCEGLASACLT